MRRWPLTLSRPLLWIAAAMLAAQWGGAITVPAAKRPPTMRKKSLDLLPHSFAGGIWDDEVDVELAPLDMATILAQDAAALDGQEKKRRIGVVRALPRRAGVAA